MVQVAVLGMGAMGLRMAVRLLKAGHEVTVWNRTAAGADGAVAAGARRAFTPADAAHRADVVLSMVRDDEASRFVWLDPTAGALAALGQGALAIECSTVTPHWAKTLAASADYAGKTFIEAPVSGSRPQAATGQLVFFAGGGHGAVEQARPVLAALGRAVHHVGEAGAGAQAKLAVNSLLGVTAAAVAEVINRLRSAGADADRILQALADTAVWSPVAGDLAQSMLAEQFEPRFPVDLMVKDLGYALDSSAPTASPLLQATLESFVRAQAQGFGSDHMSAVVRADHAQA